MFNGAAAHPFQNNRIGEGPVLSESRGTHHASSCLDRAHMCLRFTILCHVFYCFFFVPINILFRILFRIPLPVLRVCLRVRVVVTGFCVLSQIFSAQSEPRIELRISKAVDCVSGSPALNLVWTIFFGSQFYKVCLLFGLYKRKYIFKKI
jgi:hypothetical protein